MFGAILVISSAYVLQTGRYPSGLVQSGLLAYELVGAVLGVVIAYLTYRGYRRNQCRPMHFVSLGFALALGVHSFLR